MTLRAKVDRLLGRQHQQRATGPTPEQATEARKQLAWRVHGLAERAAAGDQGAAEQLERLRARLEAAGGQS